MTTTQKKPTAGIPFDEIQALAGKISDVNVRIMRKNGTQIVTLPGYEAVPMTTIDLATIDKFCSGVAGGGKFLIQTFHPDNPAQEILPPFEFGVEALPRPPSAPQAPSWAAGVLPPGLPPEAYGAQPPPPQPGPPQAQVQGALPRYERGRFTGHAPQHAGYAPAPGATRASDEVLDSVYADAKAEIAALRRGLADQAARADADRKALEARLQAEREAAHKRELDALHSKIDALARAPREEKSGFDLAGIAAIITAIAPLMKREDTTGAAMQASAQMMSDAMKVVTEQRNNAPDPFAMVEKIATIVKPPPTDVVAERKAQIELFQAQSEQQLAYVGMMTQMLEQLTDEKGDHPAVAVIQQMIDGLKNTAAAYFARAQQEQQNALGAGPAPRAPIPAQGHVVAEQRQPPPRPAPRPAPQQTVVAAPPTAAPELEALFALAPPSFQTIEWRKIMISAHAPADARMAPEALAVFIGKHLEHLIEFEILPPELANLVAEPEKTLTGVLSLLPVYTLDRPYAQKVLDLTCQLLRRAGLAGTPQAQPQVAPAPALQRRPRTGNGPKRPPLHVVPPAPPPPAEGPGDDDEDGDEGDEDDAGDIDDDVQPYPDAPS